MFHAFYINWCNIEINLGFQGPSDNIEYAIEQSSSNDRILIHKGVDNVVSNPWLSCTLQLIGITLNLQITLLLGLKLEMPFIVTSKRLNFIVVRKPQSLDVVTTNNSVLNVETCELHFNDEPGFWVTKTSQSNMSNCKFIQKNRNEHAVKLLPHAKAINNITVIVALKILI